MKQWLSSIFFAVAALLIVASRISAQEVDGSDIQHEMRDRRERIARLSVEEQLRLRAAEQKAAEDPAVKAALEKRNQAIQEFRATLRATMIKADPGVAPLIDKVAIQPTPGQ